MKATHITRLLHSRGTLAITLVIMVLSAYYAAESGVVSFFNDDKGTVFPSPGLWIAAPMTSMWVNIASLAAVIALMIFINKAYNIPRTITLIYASLFAAMQTATPTLTAVFQAGTILAAVILAAMTLMFSTYDRPAARRKVFLVFFILSAAVSFQYAFLFYIPVFMLACAQMRILTLRTVLAAGFGIITPWWILIGGGIVAPTDFHTPEFTGISEITGSRGFVISAVTAALTIIMAILAYLLSLLKLMSYNARMRACNGLLTLVTFVTIAVIALDFTNFTSYLPLLNCCAAFFLGHLFVIRNSPRAWIVITTIMTIYYAIYIWIIFA